MRPATLLCCLLCPLACGPKEGGDDTSAGDTSAGSMTGGPGATDSAGATGTPTDGSMTDESATVPGTASSTPGDSTSGDLCAEFEDVDPAPAVQISLHNAGSAPVFLFHVTFCDSVPLVEMSGPDSDAPTPWTRPTCSFTCGQVIEGICGCPAICPTDTILMIAPGGTHSFAWTGAIFNEVALPLQCGADCGDSCLRQTQAASGIYKMIARAATTAIICEDPNVCTCEPNIDGWCDVQASGIGAEPRLAEAMLNYPNQQQITLTFTD